MDRWATELGTFGIWYDGQRIENHELNGIDQDDIFCYSSSTLRSNAQDYGKYTYHVSLLSKDEFEKFEERSYKSIMDWEKKMKRIANKK